MKETCGTFMGSSMHLAQLCWKSWLGHLCKSFGDTKILEVWTSKNIAASPVNCLYHHLLLDNVPVITFIHVAYLVSHSSVYETQRSVQACSKGAPVSHAAAGVASHRVLPRVAAAIT